MAGEKQITDHWKSTDDLLEELDEIRSRFNWEQDAPTIQALVSLLVERGVYKETPMIQSYHCSFQKMVESYGAYWHIYSDPLNCPICGTDLCNNEMGPPGKREIGVYSQEHDMTTHYQCPDCKCNFNRFPPGHPHCRPELENKYKQTEIEE